MNKTRVIKRKENNKSNSRSRKTNWTIEPEPNQSNEIRTELQNQAKLSTAELKN